MTRPNITLPDQLAEPMFCKEPDDFALMVLQIIKAVYNIAQENDMDDYLAFVSLSAKVICHEYMACVLSGIIEPYTFSPEFKDDEYEDFRKVILEAKADAMQAGVPMVEKDGRFIFNVDEIHKRVRLRKKGSDDRQAES